MKNLPQKYRIIFHEERENVDDTFLLLCLIYVYSVVLVLDLEVTNMMIVSTIHFSVLKGATVFIPEST